MNRTIASFSLITMLFLSTCAFAADFPAGSFNYQNATVGQVLPIYKELSGLELVVDSRVKNVRHWINWKSTEALSKAEATKRIEKELLEQAGVIITHLDDKRASVTCNDALTITKTKN